MIGRKSLHGGAQAMDGLLSRIVGDLAGRVSGPMKFRFVLQPLMAAFFAVRSGLKDAKDSRPPYFWALFTDAQHRADMLRDGWKSVGRVFLLGVVLDAVYHSSSCDGSTRQRRCW
jgi:hypothetical protein